MKKKLVVCFLFLSHCHLIYANDWQKYVPESSQKYLPKNVMSHLPDPNYTEYHGPISWSNINEERAIEINGPFTAQNGKIKELTVNGPCQLSRMNFTKLTVKGVLEGEEIDVKGDIEVMGFMNVKKISFATLKLWTSEKAYLSDVKAKEIIIKNNENHKKNPELFLMGDVKLLKITFEGQKGFVHSANKEIKITNGELK